MIQVVLAVTVQPSSRTARPVSARPHRLFPPSLCFCVAWTVGMNPETRAHSISPYCKKKKKKLLHCSKRGFRRRRYESDVPSTPSCVPDRRSHCRDLPVASTWTVHLPTLTAMARPTTWFPKNPIVVGSGTRRTASWLRKVMSLPPLSQNPRTVVIGVATTRRMSSCVRCCRSRYAHGQVAGLLS